MTRHFPESDVEYFSLNSFYFGCTLANGAGAATALFNCTVKVQGYLDGVRVVESKPFKFVSPAISRAPMVHAILNDKKFEKLHYVTLSSTYDLARIPMNLAGATLIDDVSHTNYRRVSKTLKPRQPGMVAE